MKPERALWMKDYTPTVEDVKYELYLCKSMNKVKRQKPIVEYKQLFDGEDKWVLVKGGLGTGKILLCEKIAYEWAKGIFAKFKYVVVVFLGSSFSPIEDVVVKQYCLNERQEKILRYILNIYGYEWV